MKPNPIKSRITTPVGWITLSALAALAPFAEGERIDAGLIPALESVLNTLEADGPEPVPQAAPRFRFSPRGFVRHLVAPVGKAFRPPAVFDGHPEDTAGAFLQANRKLLGVDTEKTGFVPVLTRNVQGRTSLRLQQSYNNVPVFGAQAVVQMDGFSRIHFVAADLSRRVASLDADVTWVTPVLTPPDALLAIRAEVALKAGDARIDHLPPVLMIHDPEVIGDAGPMRLVWSVEVGCEKDERLEGTWMIDAKGGGIVDFIGGSMNAIDRRIRDAENARPGIDHGKLVRSEGDPACGIPNADDAYAILGGIYNFFASDFGSDGIDSYNDRGAKIMATVRVCRNVKGVYMCPWPNAAWSNFYNRINFGRGFVVDDVIGHEFTHAVIQASSNLVYKNASGAINESLADVFGEFFDLKYARGNDIDTAKWMIGEDFPIPFRDMSGRDVRFSDPDRLGSPNYATGSDDHGGVHTNSGVNNKLCYLITDGDRFNGYTIDGMGIDRVQRLYFEANMNLLNRSADWTDLAEALRQAAANLGWTDEERRNLVNACRAVEISTPDVLYVDLDHSCLMFESGNSTCSSYLGGPYRTFGKAVEESNDHDHLIVRGGSYDNETAIINWPLTLDAEDGYAVIGR